MDSIDTAIVFTYLGLMIAIGLFSSSRQKDVEDYFVAGRRLGTFSITCLWLASWVGGASIVGSSAKAYDLGITAVWYVGALAIGCLLFGLFFAARIKSLGDQHHHLTYPDFMEVRYDSRTRIVATITTSAAALDVLAEESPDLRGSGFLAKAFGHVIDPLYPMREAAHEKYQSKHD